MKLKLGTRGSELARTQSGHVAAALEARGHEVELVTIRSEGDVTTGSLLQAGGLGLFAAALRVALLNGDVDLVVHSFKDLPTAAVEGLAVAAVPPREEPTDALCSATGATLEELPAGARVGTGSPRRAAQLRARRPDLSVVEIRGNVGTRLARAQGPDADLDAVVLASAGLKRLGRGDAISELLDLLPAPAQGALAVECRADRADVVAALAEIDDPVTHARADAERAVLARLGAGCAAPLGALSQCVDGELTLTAGVFSADGSQTLILSGAAPTADAEQLGRGLAERLLAQGAAEITPLGAERASQLEDFHTEKALWSASTAAELVGRRILLPREDGAIADALRAAGADVDAVPLTRTQTLDFELPEHADWLVLTSPKAVQVLSDAGIDLGALAEKIAVVGAGTARAVSAAGGRVDLVPEGRSDAETLLAALTSTQTTPATALLPGSALSSPVLADGLRAAGWQVAQCATYTTVALDSTPDQIRPWADYDAVVLTSGSIARAMVGLLGEPGAAKVITLGEPTAKVCQELGLAVAGVAQTQDGVGVTAAVIEALR